MHFSIFAWPKHTSQLYRRREDFGFWICKSLRMRKLMESEGTQHLTGTVQIFTKLDLWYVCHLCGAPDHQLLLCMGQIERWGSWSTLGMTTSCILCLVWRRAAGWGCPQSSLTVSFLGFASIEWEQVNGVCFSAELSEHQESCDDIPLTSL